MNEKKTYPDSKPLTFKINEEMTIAAEAWGDETAPPVILLHGGGQTRHSWGDTAQWIAEAGWYAITYDARGHGDSSWASEGNYRTDALVEDLKVILKQLKNKPALVGASMGGITSLVAQGETPEAICSAIILVDIAPKSNQKGVERIFTFMSSNLHGFASLDEAADAVAAYLPHRPRPQDHERLKKNLRLKTDGRWYWHWDPKMLELWKSSSPDDRIKGAVRLMNAAKNLPVPTMIVRGGMSDVVTDQVMDEFLEAVPNVRAVEVSGAGHMVAGDSNHAFTHAVVEFLNEVYPPKEIGD
jgi:non-heme chloroperoxidase